MHRMRWQADLDDARSVGCSCPFVYINSGEHVPTCPKYEDPATVPEIADDDPRIQDDGSDVGFTGELDEPPVEESQTEPPTQGSTVSWRVGAVYKANAYDAEIERRREAERRRVQGQRLAAVIARMAGEQAAD